MLKGVNPRFLNLSNSESIENESVNHSDEFRMYVFKIKKCPKTKSHDWTSCPFAHRGEKARRRDPTKFNYAAIACPKFRTGECSKGESCEFAHGIFEFWLHPTKYRTRACNAGEYCQRKVCFFAHTPEQLRPVRKQKCCYVCKAHMGERKEEISSDSVGGGRTGLSSPPANMVTRDGILKEEWEISENLRRFSIEDEEEEEVEEEDVAGDGSFGYRDVPDLPDIDWITELVN
ncbi:zinc finger CCCH domain-containing protein 54 [Telopea speciosissima]|uniref:zinc finger CCCH domain-containing protein 54 n=1 Tax=Telopea speciosissima TaxID=54955 RepID=UPI001CC3A4A1|nr:zinc finger CCCH domain-containing protein 54 [Telopea speciosissima]